MCVFPSNFLVENRDGGRSSKFGGKGKKLAVSHLLHVMFLKGIFQKTKDFEWSLFFLPILVGTKVNLFLYVMSGSLKLPYCIGGSARPGNFGCCIMSARRVFWSLQGCWTSKTSHWTTPVGTYPHCSYPIPPPLDEKFVLNKSAVNLKFVCVCQMPRFLNYAF